MGRPTLWHIPVSHYSEKVRWALSYKDVEHVRRPSGAARGRAKVREAVDRLERELGGGDYLVGDEFTVADLTAASLFYPVVLPEGGPLRRDTFPRDPDLRTELAGRPGVEWVEEMYRRHRRRRSA